MIDSIVLAEIGRMRLWYAIPLIVVISLVYAATRQEEMQPILRHAVRVVVWIVGFMGIVMAAVFLISWQL